MNYTYVVLLVLQGLLSDDEDKDLSPAEQRALRAEKRAAWRQARLKSLEQVKCASSKWKPMKSFFVIFFFYLVRQHSLCEMKSHNRS